MSNIFIPQIIHMINKTWEKILKPDVREKHKDKKIKA